MKKSSPFTAKYLDRQSSRAEQVFAVNLKRALSHSVKMFRVIRTTAEYRRDYYHKNKDKISQQIRERRRDPQTRIVHALRHRCWKTIRNQGGNKFMSLSQTLLGCNRDALMAHLQSKFKRGMNWNNYGIVWEVDHMIPCSAFNLIDAEQQRLCFHYTNLQPLFVSDNRKKWANIQPTQMSFIL